MNEKQQARLRELCENYHVEFNETDYLVHPPTSAMMPGWVEGWVGGDTSTIFVGVSPEGDSHS